MFSKKNSAKPGVTITAVETVKVSESTGALGQPATPTPVPGEKVAVSVVNSNATGAVEFTGTVTVQSGTVTFSQRNPPAGLVSAGSAVPGAYKFEYAPDGVASGLCVSDPGGGWASDPLRDGMPIAMRRPHGRIERIVP